MMCKDLDPQGMSQSVGHVGYQEYLVFQEFFVVFSDSHLIRPSIVKICGLVSYIADPTLNILTQAYHKKQGAKYFALWYNSPV